MPHHWTIRGKLLFAAISLFWLCLIPGCCSAHRPSPIPIANFTNRFEFTRPEMGLPFRIVLYACDAPTAEAGANAAFQRVAQLNNILSDYDPDSELSRLSRSSGEGRAIPIGNDLWRVLSRAQRLAASTGGAFDVTVGPYVSLWRKARREKMLPRAALLAEAATAVGWNHVLLDSRAHTARLVVPHMRLDRRGRRHDRGRSATGQKGLAN